MQFTTKLVALILASVPCILAMPTESELMARQDCVKSTSMIGENGDVEFQSFSCGTSSARSTLEARQKGSINVCKAQCNTSCQQPAAGQQGPNQNDCDVIVKALLYQSQNQDSANYIPGDQFNVAPTDNQNFLLLKYNSCKSLFVNKVPSKQFSLTYCRNDFAGVAGWINGNSGCKGVGICTSQDQTSAVWFVQSAHS